MTASHGPRAHNSLVAKLVLLKECQGYLTSKVIAVHHTSLNRLGLQGLIDRTLIKTRCADEDLARSQQILSFQETMKKTETRSNRLYRPTERSFSSNSYNEAT